MRFSENRVSSHVDLLSTLRPSKPIVKLRTTNDDEEGKALAVRCLKAAEENLWKPSDLDSLKSSLREASSLDDVLSVVVTRFLLV